MPKQTFLHLSKDKQETLIQAAKIEFSRVPLHEASIANIIKGARIPRGSFYQYFDDKEDLYFYLLDELTRETNEKLIAVLIENKGDLIETLIQLFQFIIKNNENQDNKDFFKNVFLNMNYKIENTLAKNIYEQNQKDQYLSVIKLIDTTKLHIKDEDELYHAINILTAVTFHNIVQTYVMELSEEEALKNYMVEIKLLKKGLYKEVDE